MSQLIHIARLLIPVSCALLLGASPAWAGDEDMMNPYQKFDPETGFFIDDPSRKRPHEVQDQATGNTSVTQAADTKGNAPASPVPGGSGIATSPALLIGSILMLGLIVGGFLWLRRDAQKTS